jgi:hypothetical protein
MCNKRTHPRTEIFPAIDIAALARATAVATMITCIHSIPTLIQYTDQVAIAATVFAKAMRQGHNRTRLRWHPGLQIECHSTCASNGFLCMG